MKAVVVRRMLIVAGLLGASPAQAQETFTGFTAPLAFPRPGSGTLSPAPPLTGNEHIAVGCSTIPEFRCDAPISQTLVPINAFARSSAVEALTGRVDTVAANAAQAQATASNALGVATQAQMASAVNAAAISSINSVNVRQQNQIDALQIGQDVLSGRVDALVDISRTDRRDARKGIAAAIAMGHAAMPSAPGRTSYAINGATFRGEQAVGGSIMHRLNTGDPTAVTVGFSYGGNKNNAARVGVAGEF